MAGCFGLIHGFGFAGALRETGLDGPAVRSHCRCSHSMLSRNRNWPGGGRRAHAFSVSALARARPLGSPRHLGGGHLVSGYRLVQRVFFAG